MPSSAERQEVRVRSEQARARALELIGRCALLREKHDRQQLMHEEMLTAVAELRGGLRSLVADYPRDLRRSEVPPERAIVLVKELMADAVPRLPVDVMTALRREAVAWAIESYYTA